MLVTSLSLFNLIPTYSPFDKVTSFKSESVAFSSEILTSFLAKASTFVYALTFILFSSFLLTENSLTAIQLFKISLVGINLKYFAVISKSSTTILCILGP